MSSNYTNKMLKEILNILKQINNKLSDPKEEIQYHIDCNTYNKLSEDFKNTHKFKIQDLVVHSNRSIDNHFVITELLPDNRYSIISLLDHQKYTSDEDSLILIGNMGVNYCV